MPPSPPVKECEKDDCFGEPPVIPEFVPDAIVHKGLPIPMWLYKCPKCFLLWFESIQPGS